MTSEPVSQANPEPAVAPQTIPRPGRPWLGSATLLSGGVLIIVVLLIGRAVVLWWKGDVNVLGETFAICLFLMFGLAAFLSFWWVANKIEQHFRPSPPVQPESPGILQELRGCLAGGLSLPVVIAIVAISGRGPQQNKQGPAFHKGSDKDKQIIWMTPEAFQKRVQQQEATLRYWNIAVTNLHSVRFQTLSGQESAEKYYERMFQQLRQLTATARAASTANVDPELVQMATRHLTVEDQALQVKQQLDEFLKNEKIPLPSDTVNQRMALTQLLLGTIQATPDSLTNMPAGPIRDMIEKGLFLEQLRQEQFREIEIMQAVLQERFKGTTFPLPKIEP